MQTVSQRESATAFISHVKWRSVFSYRYPPKTSFLLRIPSLPARKVMGGSGLMLNIKVQGPNVRGRSAMPQDSDLPRTTAFSYKNRYIEVIFEYSSCRPSNCSHGLL
ncbi:hypothetical protein M378DRAFT_169072 [Amanita muscaria Koide BX008]|uniref:Uncharacterized protein n=1 Tax=Amanita muscaria (strain Koide BX008) TaxID=946122 RepID=A0A0C2WDY0_AMAMK|nr:hypothetical protein M378DRAFT_169072 [Amanita muscaria Koide BX008]